MTKTEEERDALIESSRSNNGATVVVEHDRELLRAFEELGVAHSSKTGRGTIFSGAWGDAWAVCVRKSVYEIRDEHENMALGVIRRSAVSGDPVWVDYDWELFCALNMVSTLNLTAKDGAISTMRGEWSGHKWEVSMRRPPREKECRCLLDSAPVLIGLGVAIFVTGMWLGA